MSNRGLFGSGSSIFRGSRSFCGNKRFVLRCVCTHQVVVSTQRALVFFSAENAVPVICVIDFLDASRYLYYMKQFVSYPSPF